MVTSTNNMAAVKTGQGGLAGMLSSKLNPAGGVALPTSAAAKKLSLQNAAHQATANAFAAVQQRVAQTSVPANNKKSTKVTALSAETAKSELDTQDKADAIVVAAVASPAVINPPNVIQASQATRLTSPTAPKPVKPVSVVTIQSQAAPVEARKLAAVAKEAKEVKKDSQPTAPATIGTEIQAQTTDNNNHVEKSQASQVQVSETKVAQTATATASEVPASSARTVAAKFVEAVRQAAASAPEVAVGKNVEVAELRPNSVRAMAAGNHAASAQAAPNTVLTAQAVSPSAGVTADAMTPGMEFGKMTAAMAQAIRGASSLRRAMAQYGDETGARGFAAISAAMNQNASATTTLASVDAAQTVAGVDPGASAGMLSQVQGAIRMAVDGNDSHVTLQLNPPELGKVVLKLQSDGGEISGVLEAENPWTLQELRREASTLTRNLADNGVQVKQLDIVQHQAPANNSHAFTQSQDGGGWANQDAAWQFAQRDYVPANTPETAEPALAVAVAGVGESYITDSSVNLWI